MTITQSYPLHRCIYRNDQVALKELLMDEEMKKRINERDNHDNTPLHLALMLDRRNCILVLLNNNCDILSRNTYGWNPVDEAILTGDIDIIEKMTYIRWKDYVNMFSCPGGILDTFTNEIPNLYMKYKLRLKTSVPIFQRLGARDIEEIYKKGSSLRFNTSVTGLDNRGIPKVIKGSISIIGKFDEKSGLYKIILLDNKKKLYQEFFPNIPQWYMSNSLKSKVGVSTLFKFYFDFSDLKIKQKKNSVIKKTKKTFTLQNGTAYKAELFKSKNIKIIIRKRKDECFIGDCKSNIKTKITNVDHISSIFKKFENLDQQNFDEAKKDFKPKVDDFDDSDNDSDDESSVSEEDESMMVNSLEEKSFMSTYSGLFKGYVNENDPDGTVIDPTTTQTILKILEKGSDDQGHKVTEADIEYLDKYAPNVLKTFFSKNRKTDPSKFKYFDFTERNSKKINYTVSKDGHTKTYEIADGDKDTLDWETAYNMRYPQGNDIFYEVLTGNLKDNIENNTNELKSMKMKDYDSKTISEEDYFDPSSTEHLHMGKMMRIDEEVKNYKHTCKFWMSKEDTFPISVKQFQPILNFINSLFFDQVTNNDESASLRKDIYSSFINVIYKEFQADRRFPLKFTIPIYTSIIAQYKLLNVSTEPEKIPDEMFEIPSDYQYGNVYFLNKL